MTYITEPLELEEELLKLTAYEEVAADVIKEKCC